MKKKLLEARFHDECFKKITMLKDGKITIKNDYAPKIKWFPDSPDHCTCSLCNKKINEKECPIRLWRDAK